MDARSLAVKAADTTPRRTTHLLSGAGQSVLRRLLGVGYSSGEVGLPEVLPFSQRLRNVPVFFGGERG